ncbi:hypothetical protein Dda_9177 [Drechslerella dactyloides]|uniref:Uncharacterized protein n=1 Tax=Drechslerella dactyloides TaxID=74499 RepID=A0AAD6IPN5_DREDA|nr:hypothetical protein Dda_9177 [Drechslerella dactyloides]
MGGYDIIPPEREVLPGETERSREVYKYFTPPQTAPIGSSNLAAISGHPSLLTHAKFTALQLRKQRVVISLVERGAQWIIAECIQTTHPEGNENYDDGHIDAFEHSRPDNLPNGINKLCRATINMQPPRLARKASVKSPDGSVESVLPFPASDPPLNEIADLSRHPGFTTLPCVENSPFLKFYCGCPLVTRKGYYIGSLCVLDPRPGNLSKRGQRFLREMACTVMQYLELMVDGRAARSTLQMQSSLSRFVDTNTFEQSEPTKEEQRTNVRSRKGKEVVRPSHNEPSTSPAAQKLERPVNGKMKELAPVDAASKHFLHNLEISYLNLKLIVERPCFTVRDSSVSSNTSGSSESSTRSRALLDSDGALTPSTEVGFSDTESQIAAAPLDGVFSRACRLMRDALDVEGVVITDAGPRSRCNAEDKRWAFPGQADEATQSHDPHAVAIRGIDIAPSELYGPEGFKLGSLDNRFLEELSAKHRGGKIFCFGDNATMTIEDLEPGSLRKRSLHVKENMTKFLPGSKSCIYLPLFKLEGVPYGSLFVWTTQEKTVFVKDQIGYLKTFVQLIMLDVIRQNAVSAEREKEGFISNISHELRSPLYGIMGASDGLRHTLMNAHQKEFLTLVQVSGNALKDTLNHVLDFSKLARFLKDGVYEIDDTNFETVDLASCTEEVVKAVFTAYDFLRTHLAPMRDTNNGGVVPLQPDTVAAQKDDRTYENLRNSIEVIIDIQRLDNWLLRTDIGGYRRVLTNLLGNALKYTDSGHIRVKLVAEPYIDPEADPQTQSEIRKSKITLTISDTGRGISPRFLPKLFVPFSQENRLSAGTGLGMSIVKQIVDILGWKIDVKSELGVGTDMIVSLILTHASESNQQPPRDPASLDKPKAPVSMKWISQSRSILKGKRVSFIDFDTSEKPALTAIKNSLIAYSREWYNMDVVELDHTAASLVEFNDKADVLVINEDSRLVMELQMRGVKPALVVLCSKSARVRFQRMVRPDKDQVIDCMWKPCGPKTFATVIRRCFDPSERPSRSFLDLYAIPDARKLHRKLSAFTRQTFGREPSPNTWIESGSHRDADGVPSHTQSTGSRAPSPSSSTGRRKSAPYPGELRGRISQAQASARASMEAMTLRDRPVSSFTGSTVPSSNFIIYSIMDDAFFMIDELESDRPPFASPINERDNPFPPNWTGFRRLSFDEDGELFDDMSPPPFKTAPRPVAPSLDRFPEILVVDDNLVTRRVTAHAMERLGFPTADAEDGQRAVDVFKNREKGFEVIIMDIQLPRMSGLEATRAIRDIERERGCHGRALIVALTGGNNKEEALAAGHAIRPNAVEHGAGQDDGAIGSNISNVSKTDTVVIGNGPSALALSYLLHGNEPWYTPSDSHPDTVLHRKLLKKAVGSGALAEKPRDVRLFDVLRTPKDCDDLTSHFPAAASMSYSTAALPLNTLLDTLLRPLADIDLEECSTRVAWKKTADDVVPHVILGEERRAGGQWAGDEIWFGDEEDEEDDNGLKTLSYAHLLSLPGYSFGDHYRLKYGKEMNPYHRPTRRLVADYYASYPHKVGIEDVLYPGTCVTNVERIDDKSGFNFLVSIKLKNTPLESAATATAKPLAHVIRCRNVVLATGIFSHRIPPPDTYTPFLKSRLGPTPSGAIGNGETSTPLLVVGSGYTAADAILCNRGKRPVIHVYRWQPDDKPSPLRGCHPQAYPGYAGVYRQMKEAALGKVPVSDGQYEGFPNAVVTETAADGTVTISFQSSDGTERTVVRKIADIKVCIGRRGRLDYLAPALCKEIGIKNLDYERMDKERLSKVEDMPPVATVKTTATATSRRQSRSHKPTLHPTTSHTAGKVWVQHNSLRERIEQDIEVAPNVFVIGSLTGDSLVRFAMGGCVYSAGRIIASAGPIPESSDSSGPSSETSSISETMGVVGISKGNDKRRKPKCAIV